MMTKSQIVDSGPLVYLDPGHGGSDPGAVYAGVREADVNLAIAAAAYNKLNALGIICELTRATDCTVSLIERVTIANSSRARAFISVHCNASHNSQAHGIETWFSAESPGVLARRVHEALHNLTGLADRGLKQTTAFYVLRKIDIPACLVECGFLSNDDERDYICNHTGLIGNSIAIGVMKFLGLEGVINNGCCTEHT